MIRLLVSSAAMLLLALCGNALAGDTGAVSSLKVGIVEVVEAGAVEAVDGVTSAGQPTGEALQVFSDSGYVAVIDLRGEREDRGIDERAAVEALGMDYVALPIPGREDINFENAARLDALLEEYDGPVLVHCGSGNRVGALLALRESLNGASDEDALELGREGGMTRLEGLVRERLDEADQPR